MCVTVLIFCFVICTTSAVDCGYEETQKWELQMNNILLNNYGSHADNISKILLYDPSRTERIGFCSLPLDLCYGIEITNASISTTSPRFYQIGSKFDCEWRANDSLQYFRITLVTTSQMHFETHLKTRFLGYETEGKFDYTFQHSVDLEVIRNRSYCGLIGDRYPEVRVPADTFSPLSGFPFWYHDSPSWFGKVIAYWWFSTDFNDALTGFLNRHRDDLAFTTIVNELLIRPWCDKNPM
ncbi:hypothetical protein GE061_011087 [Apolygus lucorum]|uniref:CUB domain-containing protein n=1 Tax=Apolygus lucorum TaxID=248454 RepID=A0A8S9XYM2_APOLU|nr:hypothetical protein GE061_011087 [Apolygus lucorum]